MCVSSTSWCQHAKIRQLGYCLLQVCETTESPRWQCVVGDATAMLMAGDTRRVPERLRGTYVGCHEVEV